MLGGLCGSFQSHGFTLDHGPHKLYSVVPGILDEIRGPARRRPHRAQQAQPHPPARPLPELPAQPRQPAAPARTGARGPPAGLGYAAAPARRHPRPDASPASYEEYVLQPLRPRRVRAGLRAAGAEGLGRPARLSGGRSPGARIPSGGRHRAGPAPAQAQGERRRTRTRRSSTTRAAGSASFPERLAAEIVRRGGRILTCSTPVRPGARERDRIRAVQVKTDGGHERVL